MRRQLFYDPSTLNQLTPRESIVLSAAKNDFPVNNIADSLCIPQPIVIRHLTNIVTKLYETDEYLAQKLRLSYELDSVH